MNLQKKTQTEGTAAAKAAGKPGRKASGLRELSPEAARLAISRATLALVQAGTRGPSAAPVSPDVATRRAEAAERSAVREVRGAVLMQTQVGERTMPAMSRSAVAPTLERLLQGDVRFGVVPMAEADGEVRMKAVVRGDGGLSKLRQIGVPIELVKTAEAFLNDVEGARIGKLTASYGEGGGGATSAEPERMLMAMQRLIRAQEALNASDRVVLWGVLVFGLNLADMGHATDGGRALTDDRMRERAALRLEIALERIRPHYLAEGRA